MPWDAPTLKKLRNSTGAGRVVILIPEMAVLLDSLFALVNLNITTSKERKPYSRPLSGSFGLGRY